MANLSDFLGGGGAETAVFQDVQESGVAGQQLTAGADTIIQFNTTVTQKSFVTLNGSNQFALDEGIYRVTILVAPSGAAEWLLWVKDTSNASYGGASIGANSGVSQQFCFEVTVPSGGKTVELLGRTNGTSRISGNAKTPTNGNEYYQQIMFTKVG